MAIVSFGREPGYPKSSKSLDGKRISTSHKDRYKIITDDENDFGEIIYDALPSSLRVGQPLGTCLIRSLDLDRNPDARLQHFLSISADDKFDEETKADMVKAPDQRKPDWSWDFETVEIAMPIDANNELVINSAGDVFEINRKLAIPILTIQRHQASFDPSTIITYVNSKNKTTFWTADPGVVVCTGIRDRKDNEEVYAGISYRMVTYVFEFAVPLIVGVLEGQTVIVLNNGPNQLVAGLREAIKDKYGVAIRANLSDAGAALPPGSPGIVKRFEKCVEAEFNDLALGPF